MALATQCPFCQTTFRVAQDQLKLRGGLVRCGNCKEVFNGNEHLVSPEIAQQLVVAPPSPAPPPMPAERSGKAPTAWPELPGKAASSAPASAASTSLSASAAPATSSPDSAAPPAWMATANLSAAFASIAAETKDAPWGTQTDTPSTNAKSEEETRPQTESIPLPGTPSEPPASSPAAASAASTLPADTAINTLTQELSYPVPQTSSAPQSDSAEPSSSLAMSQDNTDEKTMNQSAGRAADEEKTEEAEEEDASAEEIEEDEEDEDAPAFVQKAERRERLGRVARLIMLIGSPILIIALLLQATYVWRNTVAAWVPATRPLLSALCAPLHCSVGLPTNIEQLSLESSELQLVPPNQNIYTLSLLLRNRGHSTQAWPYLELTLNDGDEKAITRRVFTPREYLSSARPIDDGLAGEAEQQVKLTFELAQPAASGYRIYLFYP